MDIPSRQNHLRPSGGFRQLRSFQMATVVYDGSVAFCRKFIDSKSRLVDQMVQAARSGRQNIAEGSCAASTSSQTELRLTNVARSSLHELLLDYEDYLRQHGMPIWDMNSKDAKAVRKAYKAIDASSEIDSHAYAAWLMDDDPMVIANTMICLIHQTCYLLNQQIATLESRFVNGGGYREQLAAARVNHRSQPSGRIGESQIPACPKCGGVMVLRTARSGPNAGSQFWGCAKYPECKGSRHFTE